MARGCGNNSVELWYFGKGNISEVTIPTIYETGTAYQIANTITGVSTVWTTADHVGHTFDFINADGTITSAGKITARGGNTSITVSTSQTVASSGSRLSYVIKDRGTYALGESVNLSTAEMGVGRGAAFKVNLRPKYTTAGIVSSELDSVTILGGGVNYNTQFFVDESGTGSNILSTNSATKPVLGGSSESDTIHGKLEFVVNDSPMWHQAKTFEGTNSVVTTEIEYMFNAINYATVTLVNRPANMSSLFSNSDASGQYTDFFREGQEVLLRDHTTHVILFRGTVQELEDTFEMGMGQVVQLHAADRMKEWDDIPAEVFTGTSVDVDLPSAKIYSIIENKVGRYQTLKGGERRIAFGEGPTYKLNSVPAGAVFPFDSTQNAPKGISGVTEGKIAAERGYGHQIGRRFAFENSWFPRDTENFSTTNLTVGEKDEVVNEREQVTTTTFNKGKQKVLSAMQNLAAQEPHGEYRRTDGTYVKLDGTESEWAFHLSPNILSPTPELLAGTSADGQNDSWITNNPRVFTPYAVGVGFIQSASTTDPTIHLDADGNRLPSRIIVAGNAGFYPSDVGKWVKRGGTSTRITSTSKDHTRLFTIDTIDWSDGLTGDVTILENLESIPQFNYFEAGSRPAFSFGTDELSNFAESEQDTRKYSVTMLSPREPVMEQGIRMGRATASQQSGDRITQPALAGAGSGEVYTKIKDDTTYTLKVPLHWEVQIGSIADPTSTTTLRYRYVFSGTDITNKDWIDAGNISDYTDAEDFEDLSKTAPKFNVQIRFTTSSGHTAGDSYSFYTYPLFDNTRALKLMGPNATFSKYNHEKYSNALVYYDAEAASEESFGSSARLQAELVYGWGVQNRSWIVSTSANAESDTSDYTVRVHHGDASDPHHARPKDGNEDECINFSNETTPITNLDDFGGGSAFEHPTLAGDLIPVLVDSTSEWNSSENKNGVTEYPFRDFYWHDKQLTEGDWAFDLEDVWGASRGGRASEYLDLYRGRYSKETIARDDDGSPGNAIPDKLQIEWRRWKSGERIAAVQYVSVPARLDESLIAVDSGGVHPPSEGGSTKFPFGVGDDETKMVHMLISFERKKTSGQPEESGGRDMWPTTNTYAEDGEPQKSAAWRDFPYVRLVGRTTGTKFDFDAEIGTRQDKHPWGGRPIDTWQVLRPLRRVYQKDNVRDVIRLDLATALHKRTADMRIGKFRTPKAPYYWLEAQVDGFTKTGGQEYGDADIDPSTATTNPNPTKTIRFKLQHIGATTGTKYYNPLQYGLMIGNIVRFYNHDTGTGGANTVQNFEDIAEFCYGVITDIQPITTSPQYYTGKAYQSGATVTGTDGSGSDPTTVWTADMVGGTFRWEGAIESSGEIKTRGSNTSLTVTNQQTVGASDDLKKYVINKHDEDTFDMCGWIEVELTNVYRKTVPSDPAGDTNGITFQRVVAAATTSNSGYNEDQANPGTATGALGTSAAFDYGGPTRVKVYNMLYPGYAVFAEDVANGISAKHIIEGMRFNSRQGIIETEYHTSGKKTDHRIKKWGTTPLHPRTSSRQALVKRIKDNEAQSLFGVGQDSYNPVEGLNTATDFYFDDLGGDPTTVFTVYTTGSTFIR